MIYAHVVACSANGVIGREGQLPWHLPGDLKRFKQLTSGHVLIMGRKTYESIGRPLPGRFTIVVTRQTDLILPRDVTIVHSLSEAYSLAESLAPHWGDEVFIVGGGEIYRQSLTQVSRVYLTLVDQTITGDTSYPLEALKAFALTRSEAVTDEALPFQVSLYERAEPH